MFFEGFQPGCWLTSLCIWDSKNWSVRGCSEQEIAFGLKLLFEKGMETVINCYDLEIWLFHLQIKPW